MIYAIHYKHCFLSVLYALSLSTCVPNMHVSPRSFTLPWTVLCVTCLLCVFKQMDAHMHSLFTHTHTRARIHSFFLTLTRGKTMFSHDQIFINPKSYGQVHDVCVKKICVCRCIDLKVQLITAVSAVLSQIIYQEYVAR